MPKEGSYTTSVYLTQTTREKLDKLAADSGKSRSIIVGDLIDKAGSPQKVKIRKVIAMLEELQATT